MTTKILITNASESYADGLLRVTVRELDGKGVARGRDGRVLKPGESAKLIVHAGCDVVIEETTASGQPLPVPEGAPHVAKAVSVEGDGAPLAEVTHQLPNVVVPVDPTHVEKADTIPPPAPKPHATHGAGKTSKHGK